MIPNQGTGIPDKENNFAIERAKDGISGLENEKPFIAAEANNPSDVQLPFICPDTMYFPIQIAKKPVRPALLE